MDLSERERNELADLAATLGPEAPTLCAGWNTKELLAHLLVRERHLAAAGIALRPLRGWTDSVIARTAGLPFDHLVEELRAGPPPLSFFRLPGVTAAANTIEYVVHHEDLRRAQPDWVARELSVQDQVTLWRQLIQRRHLFIRRPPVSVRVSSPDHGQFTIGSGKDEVQLVGEPLELLLYLHGRRQHALVDVRGDRDSVAKWRRHVTRR